MTTSENGDRFEDQQVLDCGLLPSRDHLPKSSDLLILASRMALWEAIQDAMDLAQAHGASHFRLTPIEPDDGEEEKWRLSVQEGGTWIGRGPGEASAPEDILDALDDWHHNSGSAIQLPQRFNRLATRTALRVDQAQDLQDLIFGEGMVARWREQRTPTFDDTATAPVADGRRRNRP